MEWITVWIGCSIVCGILAKRKQRNVIGWIVLGFLFAIVAVIILAVLPSKVPTKLCPYCRVFIPITASVCKSCGRDV